MLPRSSKRRVEGDEVEERGRSVEEGSSGEEEAGRGATSPKRKRFSSGEKARNRTGMSSPPHLHNDIHTPHSQPASSSTLPPLHCNLHQSHHSIITLPISSLLHVFLFLSPGFLHLFFLCPSLQFFSSLYLHLYFHFVYLISPSVL